MTGPIHMGAEDFVFLIWKGATGDSQAVATSFQFFAGILIVTSQSQSQIQPVFLNALSAASVCAVTLMSVFSLRLQTS